VYLDPAVAVGGWEIYEFAFTQGLVNATEVTIGSVWTSGPGFNDPGEIDNDTGTITEIQAMLAYTNPDDYPDVNHTACEISFTALSPGVCSLELVLVEVADVNFELLDVVTHNVTVIVDPAPIPGIPAEDFVGYWKFDEGSGNGTTADASGQSGPGYIMGNPNWTMGKLGCALEFDEVGEFVKLLHSDGVAVTDDFTMIAWVKAEASPTYSNPTIIARVHDTEFWEPGSFQMYTDESGGDHFLKYNAYSGSSGYQSTTPVRDGQWHFVVCVLTGSELKIYVDEGAAETTGSYVGASVSSFNWSIGTRMIRYPFHGCVDEVAVFDRVLSDTEIQNCYDRCLQGQGYLE
jgi:hypothetical protein